MKCPLLLVFKYQNILTRPTKSVSTTKLQHTQKKLLKKLNFFNGIIHSINHSVSDI